MMAYPMMLVDAAVKAGMKVPEDVDNFDRNEFPHFEVYCNVQLGCEIFWGEHWENAVAIASIPDDKILTVTVKDLVDTYGYHSKALMGI